MNMRSVVTLLVVGVLGLGFATWWSEREKPMETAPTEAGATMPSTGDADVIPPAPPSGPGLHWDLPRRWTEQPERPMRFATYTIPAATGDAAGAECAVFYFGKGQGGDIAANIDRWVSQFENPQVRERGTQLVAGTRVSRVVVNGTYLAPSGPRMESQGRLDHHALLAAIAEGPNGNVFFKLTGPQKTVDAARHDFDGLVSSLRP